MDDHSRIMRACDLTDRTMSEGMDREHAHEAAEMAAAAQDNRPVFTTQGGGYAVLQHGQYVWHSEIPDFIFAKVGEPIPEEWALVPDNHAAHDELEESFNACQGCGQVGCEGTCDPPWMHDSAFDQ